MTAKKDLKRRIRERMQQTGESYVAARRAVIAARPEPPKAGPIEVVEMDDFTDEAAALGFKCTFSITHALLAEVGPRAALERLRDILLGTLEDPAMETLRAVALRGEPALRPRTAGDWYEAMKHFVGRVKVGVGGVSTGGTMLATHIAGKTGPVMMICHLGFGIAMPAHRPRVVLTTPEAAGFYIEAIAMRVRALR